ncbi:MAG TPA: VWA-like domain-containing protein [Polyangiaceae bacterium]
MTASPTRGEIELWLEGFVRDPSFLEAYPYYAAILAKVTPVADPSVSRMAVSLHDGRFYLHLNVAAFQAEPQFLRGVLLHEVHHIVLGHLTHPKFVEVEEPELMDLAVEMSANEFIEELLPPAITCRAYSAVGIRPGQSTWERYEILVEFLRTTGKRPRPSPGEGDASVLDDHRFFGKGKIAPGAVAQTAILVDRAIREAREERARKRPPPPPPPAKTKGRGRARPSVQPPEPDPEEEEFGDAIPRRFLVAGRSPARLVEDLYGTTQAPLEILDWRTALALFAARARAPVHTWSRPSRRFPGRIFEVPGRSWSPRPSDQPRLLVAIDTSLSMTRFELEEIARHLVVLGERAHLTIAECDAAVSRVYPFAGKIDNVVGRGGTDLRPVFSPDFLGAHDIDGVLYFTDGEGPFPGEPSPVPTLWVLTKPTAFRCPWGERARLRQRRS